MALTDLQIINRALTKLARGSLSTLNDTDSVEAKVMNTMYPHYKESCLAEGDWSFAAKTVELSLSATAPEHPNFIRQHLLPTADFISIIKVMNEVGSSMDVGEHYEKEGTNLLSDTKRVFLKYVSNVDESVMPPWFVTYLVAELAYQGAEELRRDRDLRRDFFQERELARGRALAKDAMEEPLKDSVNASRIKAAKLGHGANFGRHIF